MKKQAMTTVQVLWQRSHWLLRERTWKHEWTLGRSRVRTRCIRGGKRRQVVFSRVTEVEEEGRAIPAGGEHKPGTREEPQGPHWQKKSGCQHWDKVQSQAGSFQKDLVCQAEVFSPHPMGKWGDKILLNWEVTESLQRWREQYREGKAGTRGRHWSWAGMGGGYLQDTELSGRLTTVQYSGCSQSLKRCSPGPHPPHCRDGRRGGKEGPTGEAEGRIERYWK